MQGLRRDGHGQLVQRDPVLRQVLLDASATVDPTQSGCMCGSALDGVDPPYRLADPG